MILTVDIGNSNIAFGIWSGDEWIDHWRLRSDAEKTSDEYLVLFHNLLQVSGRTLDGFSRIVVSSVVPALTPAIVAVCERLAEQAPLVVDHTLNTGLSAPVPPELGHDLLANAVAAYRRFGGDGAIVVDFGTALSFTAVSGDGQVVGVAIAPGLRSAVGALSGNTAQLPPVDLKPPPHALARTTVHAIQSGIVFGYVGLVNEVTKRMGAEMDKPPKLVATGGLAGTIAPLTDCFDQIDAWLTLDGLRILGELNPA